MYEGESTYTRCAWEVKVGNVVSEHSHYSQQSALLSKLPCTLPAGRAHLSHSVTLLQDLCVGDIWETSERRALVSFTTALDQDTQFLVTRTAHDNPFQTSKLPPRPACPISYLSHHTPIRRDEEIWLSDWLIQNGFRP
jgi:hypothetical protein